MVSHWGARFNASDSSLLRILAMLMLVVNIPILIFCIVGYSVTASIVTALMVGKPRPAWSMPDFETVIVYGVMHGFVLLVWTIIFLVVFLIYILVT